MTKELIDKILIHGVFYKEYGEKELKHTCNLKYERYGKNEFCFANRGHYFPEHTYKKNWWLIKDKTE